MGPHLAQKYKLLIFVLVLLTLLASFAPPVLATGNSNPYYWTHNTDSNWYPPDRLSEMDIPDEEYVDLWGRTSTYSVDSTDANRYEDFYRDRVDNHGLYIFRQMVEGYERQTYAKSHTVEWNENTIYHSTDGEQPPSAEVDSGYLISETYADITSVNPHVFYTDIERDQIVKYVPHDLSVAVKGTTSISSRDSYRTGMDTGAKRVLYNIESSSISTTLTAYHGTEELDSTETSRATGIHDLDLSDAEAGDKVRIEIKKHVEATERERRYTRKCVETETKSRYRSDGEGGRERYTYTLCVDRDWIQDSESLNHDELTVTDETTGTIYDPQVNITYSTGLAGDSGEYVLDIETNQPIASINAQEDQQHDFPLRPYSIADEDYQNNLGDVTPVEHHSTLVGSRLEPQTAESKNIVARGVGGIINPPDEVQIKSSDGFVRQIESARIRGHSPTFDESEITVDGILPNTKISPNVESDTSKLNLIPLDIDTTHTKIKSGDEGEPNTYEVTVKITRLDSNEPLNTNNVEVESTIENMNSEYDSTFETNNKGKYITEIDAYPNDKIQTSISPTTLSQYNSDEIVQNTTSTHIITADLNSQLISMNVLGGVVRTALTYFLAPLAMLVLITYGFTGKIHPWS